MVTNAFRWVEIPVRDFARSRKFYEAIFDYDMPEMEMPPVKMGFLLHDQATGVGGAIVVGEGYVPAATGTLAYLNGGTDLAVVLSRVAAAGGTVILPKTLIAPGMGYIALFLDVEGNRVGLHSME